MRNQPVYGRPTSFPCTTLCRCDACGWVVVYVADLHTPGVCSIQPEPADGADRRAQEDSASHGVQAARADSSSAVARAGKTPRGMPCCGTRDVISKRQPSAWPNAARLFAVIRLLPVAANGFNPYHAQPAGLRPAHQLSLHDALSL